MIDLPPPPPPETCISTTSPDVARVSMFFTLSGDPVQLDALIEESRGRTGWRLEARAEANGIAFARFVATGDVPYREIGGLIFNAQRRRLAVAMISTPPICEVADER